MRGWPWRYIRARNCRGEFWFVDGALWWAMADFEQKLGGTVRTIWLAVRHWGVATLGRIPPPAAEFLPSGLETMDVIRWKLPRLEIEKDLGDAVAKQAMGGGCRGMGRGGGGGGGCRRHQRHHGQSIW